MAPSKPRPRDALSALDIAVINLHQMAAEWAYSHPGIAFHLRKLAEELTARMPEVREGLPPGEEEGVFLTARDIPPLWRPPLGPEEPTPSLSAEEYPAFPVDEFKTDVVSLPLEWTKDRAVLPSPRDEGLPQPVLDGTPGGLDGGEE